MIAKFRKFNWFRILLPLSTYYKLKNNGMIHPMLFMVDVVILCIPFSTVLIILMVKYVLNDVDELK
jgi:hypothetical protein